MIQHYSDDEVLAGDDETFRMPLDENGEISFEGVDVADMIRLAKIFHRRLKIHGGDAVSPEQIAQQLVNLNAWIDSANAQQKAFANLHVSNVEVQIAGADLDKALADLPEEMRVQIPAFKLKKPGSTGN